VRSRGVERLPCPKEEPKASDFRPLGKCNRVVNVHAKVAHSVFDVRMTKQDLDGAQVAGRLVDQRRLRPSHRVRAVLSNVQSDRADPLVNQSGILAGAQVAHVVHAAREDEIVERAAAAGEPGEQCLACLGHQLELHRSVGLLLNDSCARSQRSSCDDVADLHLDDVATAQLAVDREVEQRPVAQSSMLIEKEADCPNVARLQRPLGANHIARIPRTTRVCARIEIRYSHDTNSFGLDDRRTFYSDGLSLAECEDAKNRARTDANSYCGIDNVNTLSVDEPQEIKMSTVLDKTEDRGRVRPKADATITMRLPEQTREIIDTAAAAMGKSRTEFVLDSARQTAIDVLLDQRVFHLDAAASEAFADALARPIKPNAALSDLMAAKSPWA
jgi:uncharacterized protein (DUF1778 family)